MDAEAYADMLPWLVFLVIDRRSGLSIAWAGGTAAAVSALLSAWSYWRGRRSPLLFVALVVFAICFVAAIIVPAWDHLVIVPRAATVVALSAVAFVSLAFTPITDVYTTPVIAAGVREDPRFRRVNVEMTVAWGTGALLVAVACSASAVVRGSVAFTFCDWVLPLALAAGTCLWAARRWELFRLAVDSTAATTTTTTSPFETKSSVSQLHIGGHIGGTEPPPTDAVIRALPLRRKGNL